MITSNYVQTITNERLEEKLLQRENLPVLLELLHQRKQEYAHLQKSKSKRKLLFGKKIKEHKTLMSLFAEVQQEVDTFLEQSPAHPIYQFPTLSSHPDKVETIAIRFLYGFAGFELIVGAFNSLEANPFAPVNIVVAGLSSILGALNHQIITSRDRYYSKFDTITLKRDYRHNLVPSTAHEYAHALQVRELSPHYEELGGDLGLVSHFTEGHARGVQRTIAFLYREKEDDESFLSDIISEDVQELRSAYEFCSQNRNQRKKKKIGTHALGNSLMLIHEAQYGNDIYRKMLHGEYTF